MNNYEKYVRYIKSAKINNIQNEEYNDGDRLTLVALISSLKVKTTKNNSQIANVVLEDITGTIDCVVFGKVFAEYKPLFKEGEVVKFICRVSEREDRPIELLCERVEQITRAELSAAEKAIPKKLYIRVDSIENSVMTSVKQILSTERKYSDSDIPVYIFTKNDKKTLVAPKNMWITLENIGVVFEKLAVILDEDNIKITY